jgi:hypothetical protein
MALRPRDANAVCDRAAREGIGTVISPSRSRWTTSSRAGAPNARAFSRRWPGCRLLLVVGWAAAGEHHSGGPVAAKRGRRPASVTATSRRTAVPEGRPAAAVSAWRQYLASSSGATSQRTSRLAADSTSRSRMNSSRRSCARATWVLRWSSVASSVPWCSCEAPTPGAVSPTTRVRRRATAARRGHARCAGASPPCGRKGAHSFASGGRHCGLGTRGVPYRRRVRPGV